MRPPILSARTSRRLEAFEVRGGVAWKDREDLDSHQSVGQPDSQTSLLLDSREVAALLGLGRTKAYELMARSEIPVIRIGRSVRVPRKALIQWISERTIGSDGAPWR